MIKCAYHLDQTLIIPRFWLIDEIATRCVLYLYFKVKKGTFKFLFYIFKNSKINPFFPYSKHYCHKQRS